VYLLVAVVALESVSLPITSTEVSLCSLESDISETEQNNKRHWKQ